MHHVMDWGRKSLPSIDDIWELVKDARVELRLAWLVALKFVPQDSEGTFTCRTPEVHPCLRQVAVGAGEDVKRLVRGEEAGVPEERPLSLGRGW